MSIFFMKATSNTYFCLFHLLILKRIKQNPLINGRNRKLRAPSCLCAPLCVNWKQGTRKRNFPVLTRIVMSQLGYVDYVRGSLFVVTKISEKHL